MKKPLKRYDATFKRDAVELLLTSGKPLKALAVELGVCDVTLRNWRDRHLQKTEPMTITKNRAASSTMSWKIATLNNGFLNLRSKMARNTELTCRHLPTDFMSK